MSAVAGGSAAAGPALDDDKTRRPALAPVDDLDCSKLANDPRCHTAGATGAAAPGPASAGDEPEVEYGIGVRARSVWVPRSVLELFLERAAGGAHDYGLGVDLTRRRGSTELQLGLEYERITVGEGVWINKGDNVATGDEADYVLSPGHSGHSLGWFTVEFTFLNHAELSKNFAIRYGAGLGLGIVTGELDHNNIICAAGATNRNPEPGCVPPRFNGTGTYSENNVETQVAYSLPPVFPVVNAILGLQIKPTDKWTINIEGGIRTLPFFGVSTAYFF